MHRTSHQYVSPYQMILHNQQYYLMAYSEYWGNMVYHRLDHITNMTITDKKAVPLRKVKGFENGISYKDLSSAMPYMYADKPERVIFLADIKIIDQVIDWFGSEVSIMKTKEDENKITVSLKASPKAMEYWALQYLNYVEIKSPESLRTRIKEALENGVEKYR